MPIVCAVNGVAAGAGANIALACDIVLAGEGASFVQAFARIGLIPDCGGTWFLPRLVGMARARALALLAEPLPAATAAEWGMIWQALDDERLMDEAHALTARLAGGAESALALTKRALDASPRPTTSKRSARTRTRFAGGGRRQPRPCRRGRCLSQQAHASFQRRTILNGVHHAACQPGDFSAEIGQNLG